MLTTVRDVGAAVRAARRASGWSQQTVADRAGVPRQWLSRLETGSNPAAELRKLLDVLAVLGLALEVAAAEPPADDGDPFASWFADRT